MPALLCVDGKRRVEDEEGWRGVKGRGEIGWWGCNLGQ